ncbi:MAG: hypothetical protein LC104_09965 [Bacteroidales bacterium]|nr:hypothetical protein [Bacteroidales bacterium]
MTATEAFQAGRLTEAIASQLQEVRSHPADEGRRVFLFELFLFAGEWERAAKQLDAVRAETPEMIAAVANYKGVIAAAQIRQTLLTGGAPEFIGEPPTHVRLRLEALRTRLTDPGRAVELLSQADEVTPLVAGTWNGTPFVGLRDADDYFASVLEVFAQGRYLWVATEQISTLAMNPPRYPRDTIAVPARLTLQDGTTGEVFLPALYLNSHTHADEAVRLGRLTVWDGPTGAIHGQGQRVYLTGEEDHALLEWRQVEILSGSTAEPAG